MTVTAASLCTCGAFFAVSPPPPVFVPLHEVIRVADAGDHESPHPPGGDQILDGPAALYAATASTTRFVRQVVNSGGSVPTSLVDGPLAGR